MIQYRQSQGGNKKEVYKMARDEIGMLLVESGVNTEEYIKGRYYITFGDIWTGAATDNVLEAYEWYLRASEMAFLAHSGAVVRLREKNAVMPSDNDKVISEF